LELELTLRGVVYRPTQFFSLIDVIREDLEIVIVLHSVLSLSYCKSCGEESPSWSCCNSCAYIQCC